MMDNCTVCPRHCAANRINELGFCKAPLDPVIASIMAHRGEERIISGSRGSGTIFFAGCNLGCVFCQNYDISQSCEGTPVTPSRLAEVFLELERSGVHNVNLVTPGHFVPQIAEAIKQAKENGIKIPFVYNSNGYDALSSLKLMDGLIDIYMPDLKYADDSYGQRYSNVPDYFLVAQEALKEMYKQVGDPVIRDGVMKKGVLIRHLVMPGLIDDSMEVLNWIKINLPTAIVNLMDQYRPAYLARKFKEINRPLTTYEYQSVAAYFSELGLQGEAEASHKRGEAYE